MILSAHQGFMAKVKPYDAEVEYLESTGTQWIDPQIGRFEKGTRFEFVVRKIQNTVFGANSGSNEVLVFFSANSCYLGGAFSYVSKVGEIYDVVLDLAMTTDNLVMVINGTKVRDVAGSLNNGWVHLFSVSFAPAQNAGPVPVAFYQFKAYQNGELVRDFIPVRVGNVGYMYDKVSGELFGNQGMGDFVLGLDKKPTDTTVSAKSYVQDGIIAQWDGIENDGFGKHSDAPSTWKDLTGNHVATPSGNLVYREDCVYFDGDTSRTVDVGDPQTSNAKLTFNSPLIKDAINANEITVEVVFKPIRQTHGSINGGYIGFCNNARCVWFWSSYNNAVSAYSYRTNSNLSVNLTWNGVNGKYENKKTSIVIRKGDFILDGAKIANLDGGDVVTDDTCHIGYIQGYQHGRAEIYAIRVYNRILTDAEIVHNYAVDKERFGL